jgi:hypothetical protein
VTGSSYKNAFFDSLNFPLHLTAARLLFSLNPKGHGWAAAGDWRACVPSMIAG